MGDEDRLQELLEFAEDMRRALEWYMQQDDSPDLHLFLQAVAAVEKYDMWREGK